MTTSPTALTAPSWSFGRIVRRILFAVLALLLLLYLGDFLWFQFRMHYPSVGPTASSVHRYRLLSIPLKNNKVDYEIDSQKPEEDVPCVRSLFSHGGIRPCWYVTRHAKDPIPM
ncbi:MAG TPA: hypothetical protein VFB10_14365 [Candidatus Dormibacteraeota bacterium]|nr:hypothetical protein [Candidatus Dormibacteraeota bacterium]